MYKLIKNPLTNEVDKVSQDLGNGYQVVFGLDNPDSTNYQQYLKWVEAGNTPLPADGE